MHCKIRTYCAHDHTYYTNFMHTERISRPSNVLSKPPEMTYTYSKSKILLPSLNRIESIIQKILRVNTINTHPTKNQRNINIYMTNIHNNHSQTLYAPKNPQMLARKLSVMPSQFTTKETSSVSTHALPTSTKAVRKPKPHQINLKQLGKIKTPDNPVFRINVKYAVKTSRNPRNCSTNAIKSEENEEISPWCLNNGDDD
jgi:hypothetical protein